jgi:hypothetical protein
MLRRTGEITRFVLVCAMLAALSGCSGQRDNGPLRANVSPVIPASAQEIANPLRGQYEDMQEPLFPQRNPAQKRYPAWPNSYDATIRVSWRQLQPPIRERWVPTLRMTASTRCHQRESSIR